MRSRIVVPCVLPPYLVLLVNITEWVFLSREAVAFRGAQWWYDVVFQRYQDLRKSQIHHLYILLVKMAVCVKWLAVVLPWGVERLVDPLCGQWTGCSGQSAGGGASTGAAGGGAWWNCRNNNQVRFICIELHTIHRITKQLYRKSRCYVCNALVLKILILKKYLWKYDWILQVKSLEKKMFTNLCWGTSSILTTSSGERTEWAGRRRLKQKMNQISVKSGGYIFFVALLQPQKHSKTHSLWCMIVL